MPRSSRSDRGGGWVLAQTVLMVLFVVLVFVPPFWPSRLSYAGIPLFFLGVGLASSVPATLGALALGALWWRKAAVEEA